MALPHQDKDCIRGIDYIIGCAYNILEMYTVREAASQLGLSEPHVRYLLARGEINGKRLGRDWVVLSLDYKRKRKPKR